MPVPSYMVNSTPRPSAPLPLEYLKKVIREINWKIAEKDRFFTGKFIYEYVNMYENKCPDITKLCSCGCGSPINKVSEKYVNIADQFTFKFNVHGIDHSVGHLYELTTDGNLRRLPSHVILNVGINIHDIIPEDLYCKILELEISEILEL